VSGIESVVVCDTETTGFDPETCSLLEVAACGEDFGWWQYVEYEGEIPPDARATHHISPDDVRPGAPNSDIRESVVSRLGDVCEGRVIVFHNAEFDLQFLPEVRDLDVICTLQCSRHLFPDAPNHKNQTLRYYLDVTPRPELVEGLAPHRGLYDSAVTMAILERMLETCTVEQLVEMTKQPIFLKTVGFGKYKGQLWTDVPRDYLAWMRRSGNWDKDANVMHTLDVLTGRRAA